MKVIFPVVVPEAIPDCILELKKQSDGISFSETTLNSVFTELVAVIASELS
jgi:hypothetical protein